MITQDGQTVGYIFNFNGGAFAPDGKVGELDQSAIDAHNKKLASLEIEALKQRGAGLLYYSKGEAQTWEGSFRFPITHKRGSRNNWGIQRLDVWFHFDGSTWHGVNLGDNDILRVKRNKK